MSVSVSDWFIKSIKFCKELTLVAVDVLSELIAVEDELARLLVVVDVEAESELSRWVVVDRLYERLVLVSAVDSDNEVKLEVVVEASALIFSSQLNCTSQAPAVAIVGNAVETTVAAGTQNTPIEAIKV